jgi:SAM-dependent methyltransferase
LDSDCFVRDREQLAQNKVWLDLKNDFNKKIIVGYKDLWFYCFESVWSPSIDAIFLIDTLLEKEKFSEQKINSILDFGCGTGVMGISLAKFNQNVKSIYLLDSNKYALYSSLINVMGNNVNCQYNVLNSLDVPSNIEMGIVTPYYFPVIKECTANHYDKIINAGIESANLTNMVADKVKTTYFMYSSTTETQFLQSLKHNHSVIE